MSSNPSQLVEQKDALSVYLNDMLLDPVENSEQSSEPAVTLQHVITQEKLVTKNKDWRDSDFQALIFDVQGLQLAIPLHDLNGILSWSEISLSQLPEKPKWHMGLYKQGDQHTQIVDTSCIVLPNNYQDKQNKSQFIISIDEGRWGLACNKVNSVIILSPDEVKWRQHAGKRPWLAGTVLEHMCSILNIKEFIKQL